MNSLNEEFKKIDLLHGSTVWETLIVEAYRATINSAVEQLSVTKNLGKLIGDFSDYMGQPSPKKRGELIMSIHWAALTLSQVCKMIGCGDSGEIAKEYDDIAKLTGERLGISGSAAFSAHLNASLSHNRHILEILDYAVNKLYFEPYNFGVTNARRKYFAYFAIIEDINWMTISSRLPDANMQADTVSVEAECGEHVISITDPSEEDLQRIDAAVKRAVYIRVADRLWQYSHTDAARYYTMAYNTHIGDPIGADPHWRDVVRSIEQFTYNNMMFSVCRGHKPDNTTVVEKTPIENTNIHGTPKTDKQLELFVNVYCSSMAHYITTRAGYQGDSFKDMSDKYVAYISESDNGHKRGESEKDA